MRTFLISAAAAVSALAIAAPAAAQWQQPQYGYGYGTNHYNSGQVRFYQARINQLHQRIHRLERRLSRGEFLRLNREVDLLEHRLRRAAYRGIGPQEAYQLDRRIARLERVIYREARDGRRWNDHHGYNRSGWDRDRDGLDDRYERDRGRDHDEDGDHD